LLICSMMTRIEDASFVVCDVETTGLNPRSESIIEIALVKIEKLKIVEKFSTLVNPNRYIPSFITSMTGIRNEDVINAPQFKNISYKVQEFIGNSIFVAHNANFDYGFLTYEFLREDIQTRLKTVCTKRLTKRLYPGLHSFSLSSITRFFGLRNQSAHRALGDAKVTAHIFLKLLKEGIEKNRFTTVEELLSFQFQPISKLKLLKMRKTLAESLSKLPTTAGVYIFKGKNGEIYYIGKAKNLKSRVLSYFRNDEDRKVKEILKYSHYIDFIETSSELSAFLLESELIKKHKPKLNVALKIIRNYSFIALNTQEEFPRLEVTRKLYDNGTLYFGPFNRIETAENVLDVISKATKLRECDDKTLKRNHSCYLIDIKRCLGPCVDKNIQMEYEKEINAVKDFLTGNNQELLNRLLNKMKEFSERKKFEEAANVRDTIQIILNSLSKIKVLKEPINQINALIFMYDGSKMTEVIALKNGIVLFTQPVSTDEEYINTLSEKYFTRSEVHFELPLNIEKIKIIANYLVNKKSAYKIIYTSKFQTAEELKKEIMKLIS
ncbi:MAG: exonuclease domain-containing protein, partial [Ignavibacteria bacterium]|nr:exonuclease domain-containing protein [Ignavibacteria bacterium]